MLKSPGKGNTLGVGPNDEIFLEFLFEDFEFGMDFVCGGSGVFEGFYLVVDYWGSLLALVRVSIKK